MIKRKPEQPKRESTHLSITKADAKRIAKRLFWTTLLASSPAVIRGTPQNGIARLLQDGGVLPTFGSLESQETKPEDYLKVEGEGFADGIAVAPLPDIPLEPAQIGNYVIEPINPPSYLVQDELTPHLRALKLVLSPKRINTELFHGEEVATTEYETLKKLLGRKPGVHLVDGIASKGLLFNGPWVELFKENKTVITKSMGLAAFEPTPDVNNHKAWVFTAAGNLGDPDPNKLQPPLSGVGNHGPRNVMVGSAVGSTHDGPAFFTDASTKGTIKWVQPRIGFLPSSVPEGSDGYDIVGEGWGASSMPAPAAAARFSALLQRYGNYLSEEQIFTALCYGTAQATRGRISEISPEEYGMYESTNTSARPPNNRHFYDQAVHGFGKITQDALMKADEICQLMVIYTQYHPEAICQPTTIKARLRLSEKAVRNDKEFYVYKVQLPESVNLSNVTIQGHAKTTDLNEEKIFISANGLKIRVPLGNLSGRKEQGFTGQGEESDFIGSTPGFIGAGPVSDVVWPVGGITIESSVPLDEKFQLILWNTLGKKDAVSNLASLKANVQALQVRSWGKIYSLSTAKCIDMAKVDPRSTPVEIRMYPADASRKDILRDRQHEKTAKQPKNAPPKNDEKEPIEQLAYWRSREDEDQEACRGKS